MAPTGTNPLAPCDRAAFVGHGSQWGPNSDRNESQGLRRGVAPLSQILNPAPDLEPRDRLARSAVPEPDRSPSSSTDNYYFASILTSMSYESSSGSQGTSITSTTMSGSFSGQGRAAVRTPTMITDPHGEEAQSLHTWHSLASQYGGFPACSGYHSASEGKQREDYKTATQPINSPNSPASQEQAAEPQLLPPKKRTRLPDGKCEDNKESALTSATEVRQSGASSSRVPRVYATPAPGLDAKVHVIVGYFPQATAPPNKVGPPPPPALDSEGRLVSRDEKRGKSGSSKGATSPDNQRSPSWNYLIYGMLARSPTHEMTLSELFSSIVAWCPSKAHRTNPGDDSSLRHALTTCNKFVNVPMPRTYGTTGRQGDGGKGLWRLRGENEVVENRTSAKNRPAASSAPQGEAAK
ncbi:hypothetical protein F5884DRAFT_314438 [Xylogone sp. PMI_703]|nr:hypothetical protein F5884DRAFT_314438 [Xylogone sp. PMI_703]